MSNFYTLLTRVGAALHANAQVNQTTVPWTHMRLGDGNGAAVVPTENQTGLVRQVHTLQITDIAVHPDNPNWIIAEAVVPSDVGGWTVRETAIYGGADGNSCIAVGNYPETYKPVLAEGAGREMVMRMVVEISSVATVKLQIDPAVAIASRAWVESLVATPAKAGLVKLASLLEHLAGEVGNKAATPQGVQAMLDAHRWPFARITGTAALPALAFGIYALEATAVATVTLPSLSELPSDTELLLFAGHANTAAVQVNAYAGQAVQGPAALMNDSTTAFMLPAGGDWVRLRSEKAQGRWVVLAGYETARIAATDARVEELERRERPLGQGQNWKDVTAARALNVTYTNTTGRSVMLFVDLYDFGATALTLSVGGISWDSADMNGGSVIYAPVPWVIPDGASYRIGGGAAIKKWMELS